MRKIVILALFLFAAFSARFASADPIDLSTFTADPGVSESGGVISFTVNDLAANYFYNDSFFVGPTATNLSFDYSLTLGPESNDFLVFDLNFNQTVLTDVSANGHFSIDLSAYQGTLVSIDWGLIWGGNDDTGTTAIVSNVDLATVPEPSSLLLLGCGIAGLIGLRKKG